MAPAPVAEQRRAELRARQESELLLKATMTDLVLTLEDKGWTDISSSVQRDLSPEARKDRTSLCRTMAIANPLFKRGMQIRIAYIWGQRVQVRARAASEEQD